MDDSQAEALRARLKPTGERQYGGTLEEIKPNHLVRYRWAADRIGPNVPILDAACGIGYGSMILSGDGIRRVHGLEFHPDVCELAEHDYGDELVTFECAELHTWQPPEREMFGAVVSFETIEHLVSPELFLITAWQCLPFDGKLFFSVPNAKVTPTRLSKNPFHLKHYTRGEAIELAEGGGFVVDEAWGQTGGYHDSKIDLGPDPKFIVIEAHRDRLPGRFNMEYAELCENLTRRYHEAFIERCRTIHSLRRP